MSSSPWARRSTQLSGRSTARSISSDYGLLRALLKLLPLSKGFNLVPYRRKKRLFLRKEKHRHRLSVHIGFRFFATPRRLQWEEYRSAFLGHTARFSTESGVASPHCNAAVALFLIFLMLFTSTSDIRPQGFSRASVLAAGLDAIAEETADDCRGGPRAGCGDCSGPEI